MKTINFGKNEDGVDVSLDFGSDGNRFMLLVGMTGSGKSVFHEHVYHDLMARYTPEEIGFIFMDMTRVDFGGWDPAYLALPVIVDSDEALGVIETVHDETRTTFIHIEENNMVHHDRLRFEKGIENALHANANIVLVYSTSAIDPTYIPEWLEKYIDVRVVFRVATEADSTLLLGNASASTFTEPGERIVMYDDKQVKCIPF
jgi:DNA segregation ATPase FtsK/SpoIIIE-like protein